MIRLRHILTTAISLLAVTGRLAAQEMPGWEIQPLTEDGYVEYDYDKGVATATNGVMVRYADTLLTADRIRADQENMEVEARGQVRVQRGDQLWVSEHLRYNFKTRQIQAEQFRTGMAPLFAEGEALFGGQTNQFYAATNAIITSDDIARPAIKVRAKQIRIYPGKRIEARHATLYAGGVPVFYFPYYSRRVGDQANQFNVLPGYRTAFGPYLLNSYTWFLNDQWDGTVHLDYRVKRGVGAGPDVNYHFGKWGDGSIRYYYLYDLDPDADINGSFPHNRQRVHFTYLGDPATNLSVRSVVRYQGDTNIIREFFEGEYRQNPQPGTYLEVNRFWQNFSLDVYTQPRLNDFLETVERLPDVRLTGYRQQLGETPVYYHSESSAGYYRRLFAQTNSMSTGMDYEAGRADTYHELLVPQTFFGWLNVTPRVGGRFTYYSEASGPGSTADEETRGVFNTGAETSFKASRVWPGIQNRLFDMDGARHIVEPSVNYVYVPHPNVSPRHLPQFDYEMPSLRLLPIEYPDYNAIDSIDSQNVMRFGIRNKVQTKREGAVVNVANWDVYTDWRLRPRPDQTTFADLYSDLTLRPRSWLILESLTRFDLDRDRWRMAFHSITLRPNNVWSWGIGHYYLRDDYSGQPTSLGEGNDTLTSTMFARINENWGLRAHHRFDLRAHRLQEQSYSVYRDLRSLTAALTLRLRDNPSGPDDVSVAFTFSLKAYPRYSPGQDAVRPYSLWGG
jgi:lipopolysaccharide assembly outer membrane protein LptD (OstA)